MDTRYVISGLVAVLAIGFIFVVVHSFGHDVPGQQAQLAPAASYQAK
jgi:hypothetical protein